MKKQESITFLSCKPNEKSFTIINNKTAKIFYTACNFLRSLQRRQRRLNTCLISGRSLRRSGRNRSLWIPELNGPYGG